MHRRDGSGSAARSLYLPALIFALRYSPGSSQVTDIAFVFEYHTAWTTCEEVRGDTTYNGLCRRLDPLIEVTTVIDSEDPILKLLVDTSPYTSEGLRVEM